MTPAQEREWAERVVVEVRDKDWSTTGKTADERVLPLLAAFAKEVREEAAKIAEGYAFVPGAPGLLATGVNVGEAIARAIRAREKGGEG